MRMFTIIFNLFAFFVTDPAQTLMTNQFFNEGTKAARNAQYEKAIESYQKALIYVKNQETNDNFLVKIHSNIGVCLYQLKRYEAAVPEFTKAINMSNRKYQKAFYALGMTQTELRNWREAISAFRGAVKLKEDDGEAWFDLASVLLIENDLAEAEIAFRKSIKYKSTASPYARNNIGVILALNGDIPTAEIQFKAALIESNGDMVEARNNLQFCRSYKLSTDKKLVGNLEFSTQNKSRRQI